MLRCPLTALVSLRPRAAPLERAALTGSPRLVLDEPDAFFANECRVHEPGYPLELMRGQPQLLGCLLDGGPGGWDAEGLRMTHDDPLCSYADWVKNGGRHSLRGRREWSDRLHPKPLRYSR